MKDFQFVFKTVPILAIIFIIRLYQKTLSPDHGFFRFMKPYGHCRFYPTCSQYTIDSLEKHGLLKGGIKALWRILRCNPWNKGGYDPVN